MKKIPILTLILFSACAIASAQPVVNPTTIEFTPSADHYAVFEGVTVLTSYRVDFYLPGAAAPFQSGADLGKPTPTGANLITVVRPSMFALPLGAYVVKVVAIGPGGESASAATPPFVRLLPPAAVPSAPVIR